MANVPTGQEPGVDVVREEARQYIALFVVFGYFVIVGGIIVLCVISRTTTDDLLRILTTAAGLLSGVVGAVVGFYFSRQKD